LTAIRTAVKLSNLPDRAFAAFLFDMDGTILSSIAAAERVWARWARRHGLDVAAFLPTIHGMRGVDTVRMLNLPGVDAQVEADLISAEEMIDVEGVHEIAGARRLLARLPVGRWAVVTSAPRELALRRLEAAGLAAPPMLIAAEDVARGKPAPDPFLLAAKRLGVAIDDCLVFEDAPAGIAAAEAAGARIVVINATHLHAMDTPHPQVASYDELAVEVGASGAMAVARVDQGQGAR
jgi:mannitol-1-/sugar-/sorbitol-6-phosphatase